VGEKGRRDGEGRGEDCSRVSNYDRGARVSSLSHTRLPCIQSRTSAELLLRDRCRERSPQTGASFAVDMHI
jgi:hypothetical protein